MTTAKVIYLDVYGCSCALKSFIVFLCFYHHVVGHCDPSLGHTAAKHRCLPCFRVLNMLLFKHCSFLNL